MVNKEPVVVTGVSYGKCRLMASSESYDCADLGHREKLTTRTLWRPALMAFGIAFAAILLQLVQTRIYGVVFWNHLVYFIISIALLGYGISGTWLAFGPQTRLSRLLTLRNAALGFVISTLVSCLIMPHVSISQADLLQSEMQILRLVVTYSVAVLPYFFSGWLLGSIYRDYAEKIHFLYFVDLIGAGAGCLTFLFLIHIIGAINCVVLVCAVVAATVLTRGLNRPKNLVVLAAVAALLVPITVFDSQIDRAIVPERTKAFSHLFADLEEGDGRVWESSEWNVLGRVDVTSFKKNPSIKHIFLDGAGRARMVANPTFPPPAFSPDEEEFAPLTEPLHRPKDVLVVGAGGGRQVWSALRSGAEHIDAVELNPATVRLVSEDYREFNNGLFHRPEVSLFNEEGRSFIRRCDSKYDLLEIAADTLSISNGGAYLLSENYLYTVEAVKDYLAHLNPGGMLRMQRWDTPAESRRLFTVVLEALYETGVEDPNGCLVALSASNWILLVVRMAPFTDEEVDKIMNPMMRFGAVLYNPLREGAQIETASQRWFTDYAQARGSGDHEKVLADYYFDVTPVRDDSPFFFNTERIRHVGDVFQENEGNDLVRGHWASLVLISLLVFTGVAVLLFMGLPLIRQGTCRNVPRFWAWLVYFSCLGLSFIFIEISLMQRFALLLGHPGRSIALVLGALLFSAGIGSQLYEKLKLRMGPMLVLLVLAILSAAYIYPIVVNLILPLPLWARGCWTVALVAPLGFLMGMPFPAGIKLVSLHGKDAVPWMWGVNGGMTVLGSLAAIILAISVGFTAVFWVAAIGYLLALTLYTRMLHGTAP